MTHEAEHPVERARRALLDAVSVEADPRWRDLCERFANSLPERGPVPSLPDNVVSFQRRP